MEQPQEHNHSIVIIVFAPIIIILLILFDKSENAGDESFKGRIVSFFSRIGGLDVLLVFGYFLIIAGLYQVSIYIFPTILELVTYEDAVEA
jgi:preprotein translocase subunit SecG